MSCLSNFTSMFRLLQKPYQKNFLVFIDYNIIILGDSKMKIAVFNGSPRKENTSAMVRAFCEGAEAAGHQVEEYQVGRMKIAGCLGC